MYNAFARLLIEYGKLADFPLNESARKSADDNIIFQLSLAPKKGSELK